MRRKVKNRNTAEPDLTYNSARLGKFINAIMFDGKKETARQVVYDALTIIKEKAATEEPLEVFDYGTRLSTRKS
jgi:small subunit ribosomal protein S7